VGDAVGDAVGLRVGLLVALDTDGDSDDLVDGLSLKDTDGESEDVTVGADVSLSFIVGEDVIFVGLPVGSDDETTLGDIDE